jgi:hypothetical protein
MTITITAQQDRILKAIAENQTTAGQWLSLSLVRDEAGLTRADFDQSMRELALVFLVILTPEDNQKTLTPIDERNAIHLGGQDNHLVTLG